ncbi:MAG: DUF4349 domain-containing protein [Clostridia bacterium]|nr:DUF4349 domain-containing protein [Clostridia bacterium]
MRKTGRFMQEREDALERALTSVYNVHAPEAFDLAWRAAVEKEEHVQRKPFHRAMFWKIAAPAFAAMVLTVGSILTAATNLNNQVSNEARRKETTSADSYSRSEVYEPNPQAFMPAPMAAYDGESDALPAGWNDAGTGDIQEENGYPLERKIIYSADITLVSGAIDAHETAIRRQAEAAGGYVENVYQHLLPDDAPMTPRQIYITLQIPTDNLDLFLQGVSAVGRMTSRNENATDETVPYSDAALRMQVQRDRMLRLKELLEKADNVTDSIEIESAIADAQYGIDAFETTLRTIDRQAASSTVNITLQEESPAQSAAETAASLGDRLSLGLEVSLNNIGQFFQNMLVFLAMSLPITVPLAVVCAVLGLAARHRRRTRSKRQESTKARDTAHDKKPQN